MTNGSRWGYRHSYQKPTRLLEQTPVSKTPPPSGRAIIFTYSPALIHSFDFSALFFFFFNWTTISIFFFTESYVPFLIWQAVGRVKDLYLSQKSFEYFSSQLLAFWITLFMILFFDLLWCLIGIRHDGIIKRLSL